MNGLVIFAFTGFWVFGVLVGLFWGWLIWSEGENEDDDQRGLF